MSLSLSTSSISFLQNPNLKRIIAPRTSVLFKNPPQNLSLLSSGISSSRSHYSYYYYYNKGFATSCIGTSGQEVILDDDPEPSVGECDDGLASGPHEQEEEVQETVVTSKREELASQSIWKQIKEIMMFSGPATGLWICGPLMSLISTAVIGQGSSTELAALGPGTVFCDNMNLLFMFLSIATSNMVATSLAKRDKNEVQHQISVLLFVGLICGISMLLFTQFLGSWALTGFAGPKNAHLVPVASKYVQIRGLAWPAVLYGLVSQSSSLGMKDSMGPLKALVVASVVNALGHLVLCRFLGYGIAGAAWATMTSQVIAAYMMIEALNTKGYNAFAISIPSPKEFMQIFGIAAPVFVTMFSKVAFYALMTYCATAMGTFTVAAHQVMIQMYGMCVVCGEPLSQTAQSFMPELLYGVERSLEKARTLLKSLMIIGAILGVVIASVGAFIPWLLPNIFTRDLSVIQEMHKVLILFFVALSATPCTHSLEGTLLAGRDFKFISLSMSGCFSLGALLLLLVSSQGYGLQGCWCALVAFQWARFFFALRRLLSPKGMLSSAAVTEHRLGKLKAA
ncbi:protein DETOXIFICATION 46, chloroplastic [Ricinus communis]|uniref:Protein DETOXIFICATION n=1 Tax=Ricinus communis TaxID=3988 RepID=B9RHB9_RICCO|nr:protein DETOXIFICATION 46, chloroplastic [Ricinus communis]EEF49481.1 DNA-damage-inducible protein f, putative [Ricinus communis]|eukprot:XP_002512978.1 protein DETOXIFICATION 46, chloroplastic [Ricinus communis]